MLPNGTLPPVPPAHPAFGATPTFYTPPAALIRRLDAMLFSPLGQHILDDKPPYEFVIAAFTTFDGSANPYDDMLHYNQAMTLNVGNDQLLCKVFLTNLRGLALAWFHKLLRYSINSFNDLWVTLYHSISTRCHKKETSAPYKPFSNRKKSQYVTSQGGSSKSSSK